MSANSIVIIQLCYDFRRIFVMIKRSKFGVCASCCCPDSNWCYHKTHTLFLRLFSSCVIRCSVTTIGKTVSKKSRTLTSAHCKSHCVLVPPIALFLSVTLSQQPKPQSPTPPPLLLLWNFPPAEPTGRDCYWSLFPEMLPPISKRWNWKHPSFSFFPQCTPICPTTLTGFQSAQNLPSSPFWIEHWKQTVNCGTGNVRGFSGSAWAEQRPAQTCQTSASRRKFRQNLCYGSQEKCWNVSVKLTYVAVKTGHSAALIQNAQPPTATHPSTELCSALFRPLHKALMYCHSTPNSWNK